ncbi:MAG: alpha/beta fold hydrolase [Gammaproteobacteria bacterium]|jgi:pimeloyl-[acyl-carrier protein] methyl ester esterase
MLWHKTVGNGPDLVLLHGWGFSSDIFDSLIDRYKNEYRITVIDLPGHGRSEDVDGGIDGWCRSIIALLPNNTTLVGSSLGGLLAIKIASITSIKHLILVGASPSLTNHKNWQYGMEAEIFNRFASDLKQNHSKTLRRFVSLQSKDKGLMKTLFAGIEKYPLSDNAMSQGLSILLNTDLQEIFKTIDIPKSVVLGELDMLVPRSIESWYSSHGAQTQLLRTGHLPFLEKSFTLPEV